MGVREGREAAAGAHHVAPALPRGDNDEEQEQGEGADEGVLRGAQGGGRETRGEGDQRAGRAGAGGEEGVRQEFIIKKNKQR